MTFFVEVQCCRCKEAFGLAQSTYDTLQRNEHIFRCPWGHEQHFTGGPTEADKLRRERDRLKQDAARLQDEIRVAQERHYVANGTGR